VLRTLLAATLFLAGGCATASRSLASAPVHVHGGAPRNWARLCRAVEVAHPGIRARHVALSRTGADKRPRLLLVTQGSGPVGVQRRSTRVARVVGPGDLVFLREGQVLSTESPIQALELRMSSPLPTGLPTFIGFAESTHPDSEASSGKEPLRVDVLDWQPGGAPAYADLNVKLVQLDDAPTHYHPEEGGFDEVVFVRDAEPGAGVLLSTKREAIETRTVERAEVSTLLRPIALTAGDVLFVPRGLVHRPRGRSSVVVIALPGFVPGGEVRLDDDLRAINAALELEGDAALPSFAP